MRGVRHLSVGAVLLFARRSVIKIAASNNANILLPLKAENDGRLTSSSFSSSSSRSHEQRRATDYGIERESKLGEKSLSSVDGKRNNNNNKIKNNKKSIQATSFAKKFVEAYEHEKKSNSDEGGGAAKVLLLLLLLLLLPVRVRAT